MTDAADREWIESRAIAFALGQLDDAEEERFRRGAAEYEEFASLLEGRDASDAGHVPAAMLARWGSAGRDLRGLERTLVRSHLDDCESCREELDVLGLMGRRELAPVVAGPRWMPWMGGAALGVAATLAFFLMRAPQPQLHGEAIDVITPRAMRGADTPTHFLDSSDRSVLLAVSLPTDVSPGVTATLHVYDPQGRPFSRTKLDAAPWEPASVQVLLVHERGFAEGEYAVRLQVVGETTERNLGHFALKRKP